MEISRISILLAFLLLVLERRILVRLPWKVLVSERPIGDARYLS